MEEMKKEQIPQIGSRLRQHILKIPEAVFQASGIIINGRRIKSFVFTTDLAIIRNCDADAVFAVYPFTPQQAISDAIIRSSYIPVFCGVGGGTTKGIRMVSLAKDVESQGAMGVVLNAPISDLNLLAVSNAVDIPVIITVTHEGTDIASRLQHGAAILNIACGKETPNVENLHKLLAGEKSARSFRMFRWLHPVGKPTKASMRQSWPGPTLLPIRRPRRRNCLRN